MERWKAIPGTEGYIEVSDQGRVRSWLRGTARILKTQQDKKGYHRLRVTINRVKHSYKLHREVARAFIPNPHNLPQVNHRNGNKSDNRVENLEWISNIDNARHAIENGLWEAVFRASKENNEKNMKPIVAYKLEDRGYTFRFYRSVGEAEKHIGSRHICDVLKGKRAHVKGWGFLYCKKEVILDADTDNISAK